MVVFKDTATNKLTSIINDREKLERFYNKNKSQLHVGFNNKTYDNLVYRAMLDGANPYEVTDLIINKEEILTVYRRWNLNKSYFPSIDISQDAMMGALKEFEGYLGLGIEESSVPFDIDRPLTKEELLSVEQYCIADVEATQVVMMENLESIKEKMKLISDFGLDKRHTDKTNAQLVSELLEADGSDYSHDEFDPFPFENHDIELSDTLGDVKSGSEVLRKSTIKDFFTKQYDYTERLEIIIGGVPTILAFGGLHGARDNFHYEGEMWLADVGSYYPSMMIEYDYFSRTVGDEKKKLFREIYVERMDIKHNGGDGDRANILKLILNTAYGAHKAKFNKMYDPRNANNICVAGQVMLVELAEKLEPYVTIIQKNTDGILFIPHDKVKIREIINDWEQRTRMNMEIDKFKKINQKDVNNYILVDDKDRVTVKGSFVSQTTINGNRPRTIRNTAKIVDDAVVNYFVNNISPETTIRGCNDLMDFQIIKKVGKNYSRVLLEKNGFKKTVNKINRVYATLDTRYGLLYKHSVRTGNLERVPSIPPSCFVDNDNSAFDIKMLDRQYYINVAWDRIRMYKGE